jgi:hypothetical protein
MFPQFCDGAISEVFWAMAANCQFNYERKEDKQRKSLRVSRVHENLFWINQSSDMAQLEER